ncbi:MAG: hypothetical protein ACLFMT_01660 [Halobacteriales archaeon]
MEAPPARDAIAPPNQSATSASATTTAVAVVFVGVVGVGLSESLRSRWGPEIVQWLGGYTGWSC